jgi:hypothetical protein
MLSASTSATSPKLTLAARSVDPAAEPLSKPSGVVDRLTVAAVMDRRPIPVAIAKVAQAAAGTSAAPVFVVSASDEARRDVIDPTAPGESVAPALVAVSLDPVVPMPLSIPDELSELPGVLATEEIAPEVRPRGRVSRALLLGAAALGAFLLLRRRN